MRSRPSRKRSRGESIPSCSGIASLPLAFAHASIIHGKELLARRMDCRVKPGNDVLKWWGVAKPVMAGRARAASFLPGGGSDATAERRGQLCAVRASQAASAGHDEEKSCWAFERHAG